MIKKLDVMTEIVRHAKHPFRQIDNRSDKPHKHRYERRKIREYIKLGSWWNEIQI